MPRKIAVIGSNSFSGSDFIDLLLEDSKNDVIGISRSPEKSKVFLAYKRHSKPNFRFHQKDFNQDMNEIKKILDSFQPEYIVNFAAQSEVGPSWKTPWEWFETNTVSFAKLVDYLKTAKYLKKYVHISSPEIYGTCHGIKEDALYNPSTPYAISKAAADMLLLSYFKSAEHRFPWTMVRSTNVYGAHQQIHKIIPKSVRSIKSKKEIPLDGGGKAVKSFIHIRDISMGELAVMEKGAEGEIYHLSPDRGIAVRDVVNMICKRMGVDFIKATKIVAERPGQDKRYEINSSKARIKLEWKPKISLEEGLEDVICWVNNNWKEIESLPWDYQHKP